MHSLGQPRRLDLSLGSLLVGDSLIVGLCSQVPSVILAVIADHVRAAQDSNVLVAILTTYIYPLIEK